MWTSKFLPVICVTCFAAAASGQDYRINTQVFVGDSQTPVSENLTLYNGDLVYDYQLAMDANQTTTEIVIYDSRQKSFVLLDVKRELRTDIQQFELLKMMENIRQTAEVNEDVSFLVDPQFDDPKFDIDENTLTVSNNDMTYVARCEGARELAAMAIFYDAMDQFTRLKASDPQSLPPFARLELNRAIRNHGLFPTQIEFMMKAGTLFDQEFRARSRHTTVWSLSNKDRERIASTKRQWMSFKKVSFGEFRNIGAELGMADE